MSSTALVGAGVMMAGTAVAQDGLTVRLSGFTEFGLEAASDETLSTASDRGYNFYMDNEIHIRADGETAGGTRYGSKVELEVGSGRNGNDADATVDEVGLYFSGGWGRIEAGQDDGAEDVMYVGGEDAQAGTGGIDGDTANLGGPQFGDTGDAAKLSYFTPRLAGFQLGASYTPDTSGDARIDNNGTIENSLGAGANWVGAFGSIDLTLAAVGLWGDGEPIAGGGDAEDKKAWAVGGLFGFGGFSVGAGYNSEQDAAGINGNDLKIANLGIKYGFGPANVSVGYTFRDEDRYDDKQNIFAVSGDYGLMPGVTLKADYSYNSDDPGANVPPNGVGDNQDSTHAGVITVQLDY